MVIVVRVSEKTKIIVMVLILIIITITKSFLDRMLTILTILYVTILTRGSFAVPASFVLTFLTCRLPTTNAVLYQAVLTVIPLARVTRLDVTCLTLLWLTRWRTKLFEAFETLHNGRTVRTVLFDTVSAVGRLTVGTLWSVTRFAYLLTLNEKLFMSGGWVAVGRYVRWITVGRYVRGLQFVNIKFCQVGLSSNRLGISRFIGWVYLGITLGISVGYIWV